MPPDNNEFAGPLPPKNQTPNNFYNDNNGDNLSRPPSYNPSDAGKKPLIDLDDDLGLPSVPDTHPSSNQPSSSNSAHNNLSDSIDFDDLSRRFNILKSQKLNDSF